MVILPSHSSVHKNLHPPHHVPKPADPTAQQILASLLSLRALWKGEACPEEEGWCPGMGGMSGQQAEGGETTAGTPPPLQSTGRGDTLSPSQLCWEATSTPGDTQILPQVQFTTHSLYTMGHVWLLSKDVPLSATEV